MNLSTQIFPLKETFLFKKWSFYAPNHCKSYISRQKLCGHLKFYNFHLKTLDKFYHFFGVIICSTFLYPFKCQSCDKWYPSDPSGSPWIPGVAQSPLEAQRGLFPLSYVCVPWFSRLTMKYFRLVQITFLAWHGG